MADILKYRYKSCKRLLPSGAFDTWTDWSSWITYPCGYNHSGISNHPSYQFKYIFEIDVVDPLSLPAEFIYKRTQKGTVIHYADQSSVFPVTTGQILNNDGDAFQITVTCVDCNESTPCPEGEKCVDGECVPCGEQQATHFQIRFEYSELATDAGGSQTMYHLSSVIPIAGSEELVIQGTEVNQSKYYPRIRFCDSEGNIKPYTGTFSFYGFTTPDKAWTLYPSNGNLTESSTFIGVESQTDAVSNNPWFMPRVLINHIDESSTIYETECSSVTPEEPPVIEPVFPEEPVEPDEPTEPEEPTEPTEPTKPTEPDEPETGCECEKYIGKQIARAADILYEGIILLKRELSVGFREIVVEMYEARKLNYKLSMFLQNQQYQVLISQHQRLYEILQSIQKGLIKGDDGLIDIVKSGLVEGEKGLVDYVKEFVDNYEPITIENEYRTQSHRVIDNLDDVVKKL